MTGKKSKAVKVPQRKATAHDKSLGVKIRTARLDAKLSQAQLGEKLGVTFQQIQKYEKGVNRVGAARLSTIVEALGRPMSYFLEEPGYKPNSNGEKLAQFVASRIGHQICEAMLALAPEVQQSLVDMARSLTKERVHVVKKVA